MKWLVRFLLILLADNLLFRVDVNGGTRLLCAAVGGD
jgi:hypothetical protein